MGQLEQFLVTIRTKHRNVPTIFFLRYFRDAVSALLLTARAALLRSR